MKKVTSDVYKIITTNTKCITIFSIAVLLLYLIWIYSQYGVIHSTVQWTQVNQSRSDQSKNELWHTFYQFVDPYTQNIHRSATRFFLNLLNKSYEEIDPEIMNEDLEDKLNQQLMQENISIQMGGYYSPNGSINLSDCTAIYKTLVILIPYRNRAQNLISFLSFMHRYLPLKHVSYRIVLLEQDNSYKFNRAKLFNAGLRELGILIEEGQRPISEDSSTKNNCTSECFILHDVDKLPANMHTPYECHDTPWQLARVAVAPNPSSGIRGNYRFNKVEEKLYDDFFGGVTMVNKRVLLLANGMSNVFYGWGGEDDDFRCRVTLNNVSIHLTPLNHARYYYMDHEADSAYNKQLSKLLTIKNIGKRMREDGIRQTFYSVRKRIVRPLYTLYKLNV